MDETPEDGPPLCGRLTVAEPGLPETDPDGAMAVLWKLVFTQHPLDSDRLIDTQIDMILGQLKA